MTKDEHPAINFEGIIYLETSSFSSSYSAAGVVCMPITVYKQRPRSEGKHPLLDILSIKILSDLIEFDNNGQSRPRGTLCPKMSILLSILKQLFTCKLHLSLPVQAAASL